MLDFDVMSVMSEPVLDDVDGKEEENGADDEVASDDYIWGVTNGFGSAWLCGAETGGDSY